MDARELVFKSWNYQEFVERLVKCASCHGPLSKRQESVFCDRCKLTIPLLLNRFPNFVGHRGPLSPTERIELDNLASQAGKIHRSDWRDDYNVERIQHVESRLAKGQSLLDIGAADGQIATHLREKLELKVIALEKTPSWLEVHKVVGVPFVFSDVYELPFSSDSFDAVLMGEILEHVYDPIKAVQEGLRVLKPGGTFLATVPNFFHVVKRLMFGSGVFPEDPANPLRHEHIRIFSYGAIRNLLIEVGLQDTFIEGVWQRNFFEGGILFPFKVLRALFRVSHIWPAGFAVTFVFGGKKATKVNST